MEQKIETTLGELADAEGSLRNVLAVKFDKGDWAKVRYHLTKLARLVAAETKHFYDERNALVEKHGDEAKQIGPRSQNWAAFSADLKVISSVPVTLPWGPVTRTMLEPYSDITPGDFVGLGPLFDFEEEKEGESPKAEKV